MIKRKRKILEGQLKKDIDDKVVVKVDTEIDDKHKKISKDEKKSYEDFKKLYKGVIDMKCQQDLGSSDDKDLWEDCARELYLQSRDYILKGDEYKTKRNLGESKSSEDYYTKQIDKVKGDTDDEYALKIQNRTKGTETNFLNINPDIVNMLKDYYKTNSHLKESKESKIYAKNIDAIKEVLRDNGFKTPRTIELLSKDLLKKLHAEYDEDAYDDEGVYMQPVIIDALSKRIEEITNKKPEVRFGNKVESKLQEDNKAGYFGEVNVLRRKLTHAILVVSNIKNDMKNTQDNKEYNYTSEENNQFDKMENMLDKIAADLGGVKDRLENTFRSNAEYDKKKNESLSTNLEESVEPKVLINTLESTESGVLGNAVIDAVKKGLINDKAAEYILNKCKDWDPNLRESAVKKNFNESVKLEENIDEFLNADESYRYQLLDRMRSDCDYFLRNGNGYEGHLWAHDVEKQIDYMKQLWNTFSEDKKPTWLSMEDIENYKKQMLDKKNNKLKESKLQEDNYIPDITDILEDYDWDVDITTKEQLGDDYMYHTLCTSVRDAERFNYHSDYWGNADTYQNANVELMEKVEPFVGKEVTVQFDEGSQKFKILGIVIDKQYNSLGHTKILAENLGELNEGCQKPKRKSKSTKDVKLQEDQYENERRRGVPPTQRIAEQEYYDNEDWYKNHIKDYRDITDFVNKEIVEISSEYNLRDTKAEDVCKRIYKLAIEKQDIKNEAKKLDLSFSKQEAEEYRHKINTAVVSLFREEKVPEYELPTKTETKLDKNRISYKLKVINEDTRDIPGLVDKLKEAVEDKLEDDAKVESVRVTLDHKGDYTEIIIMLEGRKDSIIIEK